MISQIYFILGTSEFYNLKGSHDFKNIMFGQNKNKLQTSPIHSIISSNKLPRAFIDMMKCNFIAKVSYPLTIKDIQTKNIRIHNDYDYICNTEPILTIHKCRSLRYVKSWIFLKKNGVDILSLNMYKWTICHYCYDVFEYLLENDDKNDIVIIFRLILEIYIPFAKINVGFDDSKKRLIEILLLKGLDLNQAFCVLCGYNEYRTEDFEAIKYLIEVGADIHADNEYVLKLACEKNCLTLVKFLITKGADIHINNDEPMKIACTEGNVEIVKYFREICVDTCMENHILLRTAIKKNNYRLVRYLLNENINIQTLEDILLSWTLKYEHLDILMILKDIGVNMHTNNESVLSWACKKNYQDIAIDLINDGANIHFDNDYIFRLSVKYNCVNIVERLLLDSDTNIHSDNEFALKMACKNGNHQIVSKLIDKGANVMIDNYYPIIIAIKYNHLDIVNILLSQNIDMDYRYFYELAQTKQMKSIIISASLNLIY